jgi:hypothetical protein
MNIDTASFATEPGFVHAPYRLSTEIACRWNGKGRVLEFVLMGASSDVFYQHLKFKHA